MVRFDIDTRNHYLDHGEQFIAAPQLEDLNIKDPEVYMARLKEITTPGEQMKQFALSVFNPSNFNTTHEGRWTRNMALSGTILGWFFGGMLDSRHLHEEYHRQHNASVFDHNYRAKRHMYDTFIFKIFRRGLGPGLKAGLLCLTTGFICFGSITYRGGRLFYPDRALGFATPNAVSRTRLGSRGLASSAVSSPKARLKRAFIDTRWVRFQGGRGGDGCISMMHLFANEFAGAGGGNGGNGGHVVLRASSQVKSLNGVKTLYCGQAGVRGQGKSMFGASAEHTIVEVPIGTLVLPAKPKEFRLYDARGLEESDIIADLDVEGSMFIAARGGAGGRGNEAFLSNVNRHPMVAERGAEGEINSYELRLKMYAHVGLLGLPNAGKSTLLNTLTGARVKTGDYAFTTLHPQVGTIKFDDFSQVAISDLPGLIEDSHKNRGMGTQFLNSLQRCACLLFVIDLGDLAAQSASPDASPIGQFERLVAELERHRVGLSRRPHLVFGNKLDSPGGAERAAQLAAYLARARPETQLLVGSSKRGDGLGQLRAELKRLHDEYQARNADELDQALTW